MKKYLGLFLLLVSFTSFGQFSNYTNINGRYKWIAGKFDSTFTLPSGTTPSLRVGGGTGPGALFYSTTDSTVYQYTGTRWTRLRGTDTAHVVSAYVRNTTVSTMTAGQVVYINGSTGTTPTIALAVNTADSTSAMTFGFVRGTIAPNGFGWITTFGPLEGVNTNAYTEGEVIYLDSIPGQFTHDKPQAPYHMVTLGYIVKKSGGNGTIFAKIQNGYELEELHNVRITSPVRNNGILAYDSVAQLWKDTTLSAIGGVTGSGTSGQVAYWTGTSSQSGSNNLFWDNANNRLGIGTNTPSYTLHTFGTAGSAGIVSVRDFGFNSLGQIVQRAAFIAHETLFNTGLALSGGSTASQIQAYTTLSTLATSRPLSLQPFGGNLLIGQTTDGGQRLQVTGDVLFKGSGNTGGTTAFTIHNSDGTNMFRVRGDNYLLIGSLNAGISTGNALNLSSPDGGILYIAPPNTFDNTGKAGIGISILSRASTASTGVNSQILQIAESGAGYAPTSGSFTRTYFQINATINQTGGANGITRGLYVNPTLTAAADWRSIEWSNNSGWGLYGAGTANNYLGGNLSVGTTGTTAGYIIRASSGIYAQGNFRFDGGVRDNRDNTIISQSASGVTSNRVLTLANGTYLSLVVDNANLLLGSAVDGGQKLQVTGTANITGDATINGIRAGRGPGNAASNTAFGFSPFGGFNPSGTGNSVFGYQVMYQHTSGNNNAGFGYQATYSINTGSQNSGFGFQSLYSVLGGSSNSGIGYRSGYDVTSGIGNSFVGDNTGRGITTGNYNTIIGAGVTGLSASLSNTIILADGQGNQRLYINNSGNVGIGTTSPNASAILELSSTTKGFLPPRMTGTEAEAIASPAAGLLVYITNGNGTTITSTGWWGYESAGWVKLN